MTANVDFMRALEAEYRQVSQLKSRSHYEIFYGQVLPAPILTLGLNPGGTPDGTSEDGTRQKDGSPASSSASYFEQMENDVLDCDWKENPGLRKLLLPLVGEDRDRFRREIVKTNIAFRRSGKVSNIDLVAAAEEAVPFLERIIARVSPRLIVLTGVGLDRFLNRYAADSRPLGETIKDPGIKHVVFAVAAARLRSAYREIIVVQVAHASQFSWTYEKYGVSARIAGLMGSPNEQERSPLSHAQSSANSVSIALPKNTWGQPIPHAHISSKARACDPRLSEIATKWAALGIVDQFHLVHHFASPKFSGKRERLQTFIEWCEVREIRDENAQTVERALDLARRVKDGHEFKAALTDAWAAYPIVTR